MKRKRGHKKGKHKGSTAAAAVETPKPNEDNSAMDAVEQEEQDSQAEADTPSSSGTDHASNLANINPDGSVDRVAGKPMGHVKVKLKTSKALESHHTSSDAPSQSDTDKSSPRMGLEKLGAVADRMGDSANSLPETKANISVNPSKKAGSIKIKTSRSLVSSGSQTSNANVAVGEVENSHQKDQLAPLQSSRYNKEELDSALMVIKKVMKMDAAEPFNVPVDPVFLGIPDYFDVIDTPMDFGTICTNLENGVKYLNSEDVYKDVQYIWGNCYKYNNKGDYILDLMRRVKKNFMKYWVAAGLYTEHGKGSHDNEGNQADMSNHGKAQKFSKHKSKKRPGMRRHKSDCLCAICVLKRRRKEREERERIARGQTGVGEELKPEETSLVESPIAEGSSSDSDGSLGQDADIESGEKGEVELEHLQQQNSTPGEKQDNDEDEDEEEGENEMDIGKTAGNQTPKQLQYGNSVDGEPTAMQTKMESNGGLADILPKEIQGDQHEETMPVQPLETKQQKHKTQLHEKFFENPMLMDLCGALFPEKLDSVWRGPHSLVPRSQPSHATSLHAAVESFMK